MLTIFDLTYKDLRDWFINRFSPLCRDTAGIEQLDEWREDENIHPYIILGHQYKKDYWYVIYNAISRVVLNVGRMPADWESALSNNNGLYPALYSYYGGSYAINETLVTNTTSTDSYNDLTLPNLPMSESFDDAFDSNLIDYSKDFEKSDFNYQYHPDLIADINVVFKNMRMLRDSFLPAYQKLKINNATVKSRRYRNFRIGSYFIRSNYIEDSRIAWGIGYTYSLGSKVKNGHVFDFYMDAGKLYFFEGSLANRTNGTFTNFLEEWGFTPCDNDKVIWKYNN